MPTDATTPARFRFDRRSGLPLEIALRREWLETDGLDGYASGTILLCAMRRYHGLLVTPAPGQTQRHVWLSRYDESLHREQDSIPLSMARYAGIFAPHGHKAFESFELRPYPSFQYRSGRTEVRRELLLVHGAQTCMVRYVIDSPRTDIVLRLKPLLPFRAAGALTHENLALNPRPLRRGTVHSFRPYSTLPEIHFTLAGAHSEFHADPVWYRRIEYPIDLERGYDSYEDQFSPGSFDLQVVPGQQIVIAATIDSPVADPLALWHTESTRRQHALAVAGDSTRAQLQLGAEAFLIRTRAPGRHERARLSVAAGWPWFGEWGRDTFLSVPGLTLARRDATGLRQCGEVLAGALPYLDDGLLPNIFGAGRHDSDYGSVDASLWFARAVRLYEEAGAPAGEILERFHPALRQIADCYTAGTAARIARLQIRADEQSMLHAGSPELNPTWMDARVAGVPVTPRHGCAVELNALWYFLLQYLEELGKRRGDRAEVGRFGRMRRALRRAFLARLWDEEHGLLADLWRDGRRDTSVRPNMVIAAALEWSPLNRAQRTSVVRVAEAELLTPMGLRTLEPGDPSYLGHYRGPHAARDRAYHQGTVWPWLLGFYVEASLRAFGRTRKTVQALRARLDAFEDHLRHAGVGFVSEVFDGDPPHEPGGTIAQAWSSAELLRAYALLDEEEG